MFILRHKTLPYYLTWEQDDESFEFYKSQISLEMKENGLDSFTITKVRGNQFETSTPKTVKPSVIGSKSDEISKPKKRDIGKVVEPVETAKSQEKVPELVNESKSNVEPKKKLPTTPKKRTRVSGVKGKGVKSMNKGKRKLFSKPTK